MPRLAQILIGADFKKNGVISIDEMLRTTIDECGCVSLLAESERYGLPMERIRESLQSLSGVTCDDESCCITDLSAFSEKMKQLAGGE